MSLTYTVVSGTLPSGVTIDPDTGVLRGITNLDDPPVWVTNAGLIADVGEMSNVSIQLSATNNSNVTYFVVPVEDNDRAALPIGVLLDSQTGLISGNVGEVWEDDAQPFLDSQLPQWVTNAGEVLSVDESTSITPVTLAANARSVANATINRYAIISGGLPFGLTMNSVTGVISGSVPEDTSGDVAPVANAPTWVTIAGRLGFVNENTNANFTMQANAVAGRTIERYTVVDGYLPIGLTMNAITGVLTGPIADVTDPNEPEFPPTGGPSWVTTAGELLSLGEFANANITLTANATTGRTISRYTVVSGGLPFGLTINSVSGALSGTVGEVTDPTEAPYYPDGPTWVTAAGTLGTYAANAAVSITLSSTAGAGVSLAGYFLAPGDTLPAGIVLAKSTGVLTGNLLSPAGTYSFTIFTSDSGGGRTSREFSITVT